MSKYFRADRFQYLDRVIEFQNTLVYLWMIKHICFVKTVNKLINMEVDYPLDEMVLISDLGKCCFRNSLSR